MISSGSYTRFSTTPDAAALVQSVFGLPSMSSGRGADTAQAFNPVTMVPAMGKLISVGKAVSDVGSLWNSDNPWTQSKHKNLFRAAVLGNTHFGKAIMNLTAPDE